jgi:formate hydrogenlyase subunit 4
MFGAVTAALWWSKGPALALVAAALAVVLLAENARIPVDDPNTHLELTMIHEVMVLDHGGPDFAFILYGSALKLWVFGALLVGLVLPVRTGSVAADAGVFLAGMFVLAALVGVVESTMARLRLVHVPRMLVGAAALALLALVLVLR